MDTDDKVRKLISKDEYLSQINILIDKLNGTSDRYEKEIILKTIKHTDREYLESQGMDIHGHILFTRHGECDALKQKKLGLKPNAPISERAKEAMEQTKYYTHAMLMSPDKKPTIRITPLVRGVQTATLVLPSVTREADIGIMVELSEDSSAFSGLDVRTIEDMKKLIHDTHKPGKKIFFSVAKLYAKGKENLLNELETKRAEAAKELDSYGGNKSSIYEDTENKTIASALDYEGDKIEAIMKLINETTTDDLWLIGHGKNFAALFKSCFGNESSFDYCETRSLYKIQSESEEPTLFFPPYSLQINQQNGKIEGYYTGQTAVLRGDYRNYIHQSEEVTDDASISATTPSSSSSTTSSSTSVASSTASNSSSTPVPSSTASTSSSTPVASPSSITTVKESVISPRAAPPPATDSQEKEKSKKSTLSDSSNRNKIEWKSGFYTKKAKEVEKERERDRGKENDKENDENLDKPTSNV